MHSCSTLTPTRRLDTGSNAAKCPPKFWYFSVCTRVITCIRPCAPTALWANGLKFDSMAMMARMRVGSSLVRVPMSYASATRTLRGSGATLYFLLSQKATAACSLGRSLGLPAVARSLASGSTGMPMAATCRSCSQFMSCSSPAWRRSGRAVSVIATKATAKPMRAKLLWVISRKPLVTSVTKVRRPETNFPDAVIALPF